MDFTPIFFIYQKLQSFVSGYISPTSLGHRKGEGSGDEKVRFPGLEMVHHPTWWMHGLQRSGDHTVYIKAVYIYIYVLTCIKSVYTYIYITPVYIYLIYIYIYTHICIHTLFGLAGWENPGLETMFILFDSFFQDFHSESVYDRVEFDVLQMKRSLPANKRTISPHLPLIGYCKSLSLDVHYLHNSPPIYIYM